MVMVGSEMHYSATADTVVDTVVREASRLPGVIEIERGDKARYSRWDARADRYASLEWQHTEGGIGASVYYMDAPVYPTYPFPGEERSGAAYAQKLVVQLEHSAVPELVIARLERMLRPKLAAMKLSLETEWPIERGREMNSLSQALRMGTRSSSNLWRVRELVETGLERYPQLQGLRGVCSHLVLGGMASEPRIDVEIETDAHGMWIWVTDGYLRHCFRSQLRVDLLEDSSDLMAQRLGNWLHRNLECRVRIR